MDGRVSPEPIPQTGGDHMRQGNHFRALSRKALSYQKRQIFTNVCCICLLPVLMILICAILSKVVSNSLHRIPHVALEYIYCSNLNAMSSRNWPLQDISSASGAPITPQANVPGATEDVININEYILISTSTTGNPGVGTLGFVNPCVRWFGENYPLSALYEQDPQLTGVYSNPVFRRDTTYTAEPLQGWVANLLTGGTMAYLFSNIQMRPWSYTVQSNNIQSGVLGTSPQLNPVTNFTVALATFGSTPYAYKPANVSNGLLDTIAKRYWLNVSFTAPSPFQGIQQVPYFTGLTGSTHTVLDGAISEAVSDTLALLANLNKSSLTNISATSSSTSQYLASAQQLSSNVPYGGLYFDVIDYTHLYFRYIMQIGTDSRLVAAVNFPAQGLRQVLQQAQLSNAFLRFSNPSALGNSSITQGVRIMPEFGSTKISIPFGSLIGNILYPFGISFLLPIFVITLVKEKEDRILVMMKMNGLKVWAYYLSHYIAVSLAFSHIFNRSRIALIIVFILVLCGVIIQLVVNRILTTDAAPAAMFIWPPFAFYRALYLMNISAISTTSPGYSFRNFAPGDEVFTAMMFLIGDTVVYLIISWYLYSVIPTEFGIHKPWHFPVTDTIRYFQKRQRMKLNGGVDPNSEYNLAVKIAVSPEELQFEDDDVKAEKQRIETEAFPHDSPLILKNMRKVYKGRGGLGPKIAVKDVSFAVESGIVFGLLGPNGAGKTTLISILTGLYEASHGTALLAGKNIKTETKEVYGNIGICPQFDILWDDLTVGEHLYFYARLKGVSPSNEREAVQESLRQVALEAFEGRLTKGLSGGEKRRLSIAIALVGNPAVVFLDEPTTGLDPEVRRLIWNIVNKARAGRTIVLTTHSMEEAEALCQRIGIMAKGTLRCLASPIRLKEKYGSGFRIFFNSQAEDSEHARSFIESVLPPGWKRLDSFATNASYEFPPQPGAIANLFKVVETHKAEARILDWGISQTTLEEVFLRLISENDADAD
ncbi:uncharacterized protein BJ171DRAFT_562062 [Polychytrium aggregatum]|uniref:uncharacterized protein n=1 Tax=Polychytrium aggregatum TaxID=110093 RepID=UPI0022FF3A42|nr:uncharacterized protein BJ171DRAFT_562062 [Polychytrium aggregatum]KAI9204500.1 hypothetical protein BJ171DRAFT_562062 [Polychytrium aggregatum]